MFQQPESIEAAAEFFPEEDSSRGSPLRQARIEAAKRAFTTRRVEFSGRCRLLANAIPCAGDLILARIEKLGNHQKLETPHGRRAQLYEDDEIIVAYGERYAPDQFEAVIPSDLGPCDLVAGGGVAGRVLSKHVKISRATRIVPLGLIGDPHGCPFNLAQFALVHRLLPSERPRVIAVAGSSMNAGKTTAAAGLIHGLVRAGLKVAATKVTGTGSGGDIWSMVDAGAQQVIDFTDMGHASTAGLALAETERIAISLIAHSADGYPDVIVVEFADGLLQRETAALLTSARMRAAIDGVLFAAPDAMSAVSGREWLLRAGHHVIGVSGLISASPLASREAAAAMNAPVLTLDQLRDPVEAPKLAFTAEPNRTVLMGVS